MVHVPRVYAYRLQKNSLKEKRIQNESNLARPNGLRVSRRLEGTPLIDREGLFPLPAVKIAPIQPVGYTRLFGGSIHFVLS